MPPGVGSRGWQAVIGKRAKGGPVKVKVASRWSRGLQKGGRVRVPASGTVFAGSEVAGDDFVDGGVEINQQVLPKVGFDTGEICIRWRSGERVCQGRQGSKAPICQMIQQDRARPAFLW